MGVFLLVIRARAATEVVVLILSVIIAMDGKGELMTGDEIIFESTISTLMKGKITEEGRQIQSNNT